MSQNPQTDLYKNMPKKEVKADLWVNDLLRNAGIKLDPQGSEIKELNDKHDALGKTPLKHFIEFVNDRIYKYIICELVTNNFSKLCNL